MPALLTCKHGARDRGRMDQGGGWSRSGATIIRTGVLIVIVVGILGTAIVPKDLPPLWRLPVAALDCWRSDYS